MTGLTGVVDYGAGNIGSIVNMLRHIGEEAAVVSSAESLDKVDRAILPGVGHFDFGVRQLHDRGLFAPLSAWGRDPRPLLGVCLGMQLLGSGSEEGSERGLDLIPGWSRRFVATSREHKIPHMGWNTLIADENEVLFGGHDPKSRYYFVHSYFFEPVEAVTCVATTDYIQSFCSATALGQVRGVQFHPEKSHRFGMALLRRFARAC